MKAEQIDRINELARLSKVRALTEEEQKERAALRAQYLQAFRQNFKSQLDSTVVQYPDGTRVPLKEAPKNENR